MSLLFLAKQVWTSISMMKIIPLSLSLASAVVSVTFALNFFKLVRALNDILRRGVRSTRNIHTRLVGLAASRTRKSHKTCNLYSLRLRP